MIDSLLNLLFRCSHRRLTNPLTPVSKKGVPDGNTYVVCLDCGKHFEYDLKEMRIGKVIESSENSAPKEVPAAPKNRLKFAIALTVPVAAALFGAILRIKKLGLK